MFFVVLTFKNVISSCAKGSKRVERNEQREREKIKNKKKNPFFFSVTSATEFACYGVTYDGISKHKVLKDKG